MHHLHLKSRNTDAEEHIFGDQERLNDVAARNAEHWHAVMGPAQPAQVQAQIDRLVQQRASLQFDHDHSAINSGPRFRRMIEQVSTEIRTLNAWLNSRETSGVAAE